MPTLVTGCIPAAAFAGDRVALLLDGAPYGSVFVTPDGDGRRFELPLPTGVLAATLDVVGSGPGGASVLPAPFDFGQARALHWDGWRAEAGSITGRFRISGPAAPPAGHSVLVEILHAGRQLCRGFARAAAPGAFTFAIPLPTPPHRLWPEWRLTPRVGGLALPHELTVPLPEPARPSAPPELTGEPAVIARFLTRAAAIRPASLARLRRAMTDRTRDTRLSIIMPVFDPPRAWLQQALDSVTAQWSANWELICVDDGSTQPHVRATLNEAAFRDPRIRILRTPANGGIARATNHGLRIARGRYVTFLDHDDMLEPDAVFALADTAQRTGAALITSDELLTNANAATADPADVLAVRARPAFSHDYYLSHPYVVHMVCLRTALARQLGGLDESLAISADVDFVLRAIEHAGPVTHVPRVLYRWRTHGQSAGHAKMAEVTDATLGALNRHLGRIAATGQDPARASPGLGFNEYRVDWPAADGDVLAVLAPHGDLAAEADRLLLLTAGLEREGLGAGLRGVVADPRLTLAQRINQAVREHSQDAGYILLVSSSVQARVPGWARRLRSLAARPEVGCAAPLLVSRNGEVCNAGLLVAGDGSQHALMHGAPAFFGDGRRDPGPNCALTALRACSIVSHTCLMLRRDVFDQFGGFDEGYTGDLAAADFCLRLGEAGLRVLCDGFTLLQGEAPGPDIDPADAARLQARWPAYFRRGDPYHSPLLDPLGSSGLRTDGRCNHRTEALIPRESGATHR